MSDCPNFGKLIGGCRFEPRYDLGPAEGYPAEMKGIGSLAAAMEPWRRKTYVRDVCTRCGRTVERGQ
jgi:hypothetical protein